MGTAGDAAYALALQPNGKIVIAGTAGTKVGVVRVNSDGTLDTSFDSDGKALIDAAPGTFTENVFEVLIDPSSGKITLVGNLLNTAGMLIRLNANGSLDTTFGGTGVQYIDPSLTYITQVYAAALDSSNRIIVGGSSSGGLVVARFTSSGALDTTFNASGSKPGTFAADIDPENAYGESVRGIAVQPDGKIVAVGMASFSYLGSGVMTSGLFVIRLTSSGTFDTSFSDDGKYIYDTDTPDSAQRVLIDHKGRIVVSGSSNTNMTLLRLNTDGSLDSTFDNDGILTTDFGASETAYGLVEQPDGRLIVAGSSSGDFAVARYNASVGNERLYATSDVQASVTATVDRQGVVRERYAFTPYGARTVYTATLTVKSASTYGWSIGHQGGREDDATRLAYFRNRWLHVTIGRWATRDPAGYVNGPQLLMFVGDHPTDAVDPYGLQFYEPPIDPDKPPVDVIGDRSARNRGRWAQIGTFDDKGLQILGHWMGGTGTELDVSDSSWQEYMLNNTVLPPQLRSRILADAQSRMISGDFDDTFQAAIEDGYFTGYEMLHGSNGSVGGMHLFSQVRKERDDCGNVKLTYEVEYTWNDIIDPQWSIPTDATFADLLDYVSDPKDYVIRIKWHATAVVTRSPDKNGSPGEVIRKEGYPFEKEDSK
ncbi:MAG: RHS repeat-associated core domain-containing protein [Tepidisphaeraceae bacterium]